MNDALAKRVRLLASAVTVLLLLLLLGGGWGYFQLRGSLPQLDGSRRVAGLGAGVTIARDHLGVPSIRGQTRADVARALGFLHAQDRFFQMDLLRRRAAGELAEVFGRRALPLDRSTRAHGFRGLARKVLAGLPPEHRALLDSYAAGANAGLAALQHPPFEYTLLRTTPAPWLPEDSVLIAYAMTLDLQDPLNVYEQSLNTLRDQLGMDAVAFFAPLQTPDDAALDGSTAPLPPVVSPAVIDVRRQRYVATARRRLAPDPIDREFLPGSNSFALTGAHTTDGGALLANDPHLNLRVPNIWYRALLEWKMPAAGGADQRVMGVTIPGLPFVVLGSNEHIAWGMTFAYADTSDLVAIDVNPVSPDLYKIPGREELLEIETRRDVIAVKGEKPETLETRWTHWGPIIGKDSRGRPLANHWTAYNPEATNLNLMRLEAATTTAEALEIAQHSGMPAHNFLVADTTGTIGWTIAGRLPRRIGFDGRLPVSWTFGDRRWDGFVAPADVPVILLSAKAAPAAAPLAPSPLVREGRLWTANNRLLGGAALGLLGDAGYASPPRAAQIRDAVAKLERAQPQDFLAVQLDDRAVFLERWRTLLLAVLTPEAIAQKKSRRLLREAVDHWEGRASIDSVSYRLVRAFRGHTAELVLEPVFARCVDVLPAFNWHAFNYEPALWAILQQRPPHLLSADVPSWDALLLSAVDQVTTDLDREGVSLRHATWGSRNSAKIEHPLAGVLPFGLGRWLNMPADPLPGDLNMPRIQNPSFGASMRMVVSPGHEAEGLFEMPGGESGHPLSPFYRAGHEAWVHGAPTPFLPGEAKHTLTLVP